MEFGVNQFQNQHSQVARDLEDEAVGGDLDKDHHTRIEREHMFDKVVTPSDVGKLNRLVIPKQHAERYFPLDSSTHEKGLLLNFEDRNGKSWRFRYSYWNSSQSYVMTKGWSRFVKEKRLDAGDIVSFERGLGEFGRDHLYIDWRHRPELPADRSAALVLRPTVLGPAWSSLLWRPPYPPMPQPHLHTFSQLSNNSTTTNNTSLFDWNNSYARSGSCSYGYGSVVKAETADSAVFYLRSGMEGGEGGLAPQLQNESTSLQQGAAAATAAATAAVVYESVPVVVHGNLRTPKRSRLRLFGVNMECPVSSATDECDLFLSSSNSISHQRPSSSLETHKLTRTNDGENGCNAAD